MGPRQAAHLLHRRRRERRGSIQQGCEHRERVGQRPVIVALLPYVQRLIQGQRRLLCAAGSGLSGKVVIVSQCKQSKETVRHNRVSHVTIMAEQGSQRGGS